VLATAFRCRLDAGQFAIDSFASLVVNGDGS
jgi:hypothetical protein